MTESAQSKNNVPLETSIPDGAVSLESILRTEELHRRPWRPPDHGKENRALVALVSALADSPRTILQTLAEKVVEVLQADSAGLSLLTKDEKRFYWAAIAGGSHTSGAAPRAVSAPAATCSTATSRCCSLTGSGAIPTCVQRHHLPKKDCLSRFTSMAKRSGQSGRSPTMINANSTPRTCGCLKVWVGSRRRRIRLWRRS